MHGGIYAPARSGWRGIGALLGKLLSPFAYFHLFFTTLDDDTDPDPECRQFYVHLFSPSTLPHHPTPSHLVRSQVQTDPVCYILIIP